jgi:proline iminopeptidase
MLEDRFTVHLWDQRGAGRSSHTGPYTTERFVADLDAVRSHFGHESWAVGGHSWGASLALLYALEHSARVKALLYLCGTGLGWSRGPQQAYRADRLARLHDDRERYLALSSRDRTAAEDRELRLLTEATNYFDRDRAKALAELHLDDRFDINWEANRALHLEDIGQEEQALVARIAALDVPALVLHCEGDPRPAWACDSLVEALPRVARVVVPNAGHEPWLENAAGVQHALRAFLLQEYRTSAGDLPALAPQFSVES